MSNKKWIIIFSVICIVLGIISAVMYFSESSSQIAVILSDGNEIERIDLSEVKKPYTFKAEYEGGYNIVSVSEGKISIIEASCPDGVCVKHGELKNEYDSIICIPNKLVIQYEEKSDSIDFVVGR